MKQLYIPIFFAITNIYGMELNLSAESLCNSADLLEKFYDDDKLPEFEDRLDPLRLEQLRMPIRIPPPTRKKEFFNIALACSFDKCYSSDPYECTRKYVPTKIEKRKRNDNPNPSNGRKKSKLLIVGIYRFIVTCPENGCNYKVDTTRETVPKYKYQLHRDLKRHIKEQHHKIGTFLKYVTCQSVPFEKLTNEENE